MSAGSRSGPRRRGGMLECWWAARHLDRWLDGGRSGPLSPAEVERVERHLEVCDRCARTAADRARVDAALARLGERDAPPADVRARVDAVTRRLRAGGPPEDRA